MVIIPEDTHFCCLALNGPWLAVKQEHSVLPGITVADTQDAFDLEPHWVEWLGSIQAESFGKSSLYITAVPPSRHEAHGLPLHQFLDNRVRLLHHALALLGCGYNDAMLMVGGNKYLGGSLHIGPVRSGLTPCFRPSYRKRRKIETADLDRAATILTSLEKIYRHALGSSVQTD